jgi:hypothetical protein
LKPSLLVGLFAFWADVTTASFGLPTATSQ